MSAFLGPVHYWLYNKILNLEKLELKLKGEQQPEKGMLIGQPLEAVIDESQIHQSLQDMIKTTEIRFAKVLNQRISETGDKAVLNIFGDMGFEDGKQSKIDKLAIEGIYKKLNDFILDGMPCDTINNIMDNQSDLFRWQTPTKLHKPYWDEHNLDVNVYYQMKKEYITQFIRAFDENLSYDYTEIEGIIIHTITGGNES
jgi:hypothetical protein